MSTLYLTQIVVSPRLQKQTKSQPKNKKIIVRTPRQNIKSLQSKIPINLIMNLQNLIHQLNKAF